MKEQTLRERIFYIFRESLLSRFKSFFAYFFLEKSRIYDYKFFIYGLLRRSSERVLLSSWPGKSS